jgi:hypothetical protein
MSIRTLVPVAIILAVLAGWLYILFVPAAQLPIDTANGSYANHCCGVITLRNGTMFVRGQVVSYVIDRDKTGPSVNPSVYVGVLNGRIIEVNRSKFPSLLRLDKSAKPETIEVMSDGPTYTFVRQPLNAP